MQDITQTTHSNSIILWGVSASPYVRKVKIALEEKTLPYEQREILPKFLLKATGQPIPADFEKISPLGKIPALQVGEFGIADSAVIAGYLDQKFPHTLPQLYPTHPEEKARALWFEHYSDSIFSEVGYKKIFFECVVKPKILQIEPNIDVVKKAKAEELPLLLDYLNQSVTQFNWLAGETFSMADIAIATQILSLKMAGFELDPIKWEHLKRYLDKVLSRPSFKKLDLCP